MLAARGPSFNGLTVGVMRPAGHLFFLDYLLNEMDALEILYDCGPRAKFQWLDSRSHAARGPFVFFGLFIE